MSKLQQSNGISTLKPAREYWLENVKRGDNLNAVLSFTNNLQQYIYLIVDKIMSLGWNLSFKYKSTLCTS